MKYANMILRFDNTFDFYSNLKELHNQENFEVGYNWFQRQLKKDGTFTLKNGSTVYRKEIKR